MDIYILIGISILVISVIFFIILFSYRSKYLIYDIKIEEAMNELEVLYEIKKKTLSSICDKVSAIVDKELFPNIEEIGSEEIGNFELSKKLEEIETKLSEEMNLRRAFVPDEELTILFTSLEDISTDCNSVEQYYNDNAICFNSLLKKFPSNIVGKVKDYNFRSTYAYEKEEMFEILKD